MKFVSYLKDEQNNGEPTPFFKTNYFCLLVGVYNYKNYGFYENRLGVYYENGFPYATIPNTDTKVLSPIAVPKEVAIAMLSGILSDIFAGRIVVDDPQLTVENFRKAIKFVSSDCDFNNG